MKTKLTFLLIIAAAAAGFFFSCENPIALGVQVNLDGPDVEISTPLARQPVDGIFSMSGTVNAKGRTTIDRMIIKVKSNKETVIGSGVFADTEYPLQWRYQSGEWEVSGNLGGSWQPLEVYTDSGRSIAPTWNGDAKSANWELPIDMNMFGLDPEDGQYQFSVTAWDSVGNSDDNSYKTRTVIVSRNPPIVNIVLPNLYSNYDLMEPTTEFFKLNAVADDDDEARRVRRDPANIGKLLTGPVTLQFQIDSKADVWSVDIRFYDKTTQWDDNEEDYIYRTFINDAQNRPPVPALGDTLNPFYRIEIPDMSKTGFFRTNIDGRSEELKQKIEEKTSLRVVVRCMDAAGNQMEEKDKGLFIYWPKADYPWLVFPDGLKNEYPGNLYTLYPDSVVPIKAFDNTGVDYIKYDVYTVEIDGTKSAEPLVTKIITDESKSRVFSWEFIPPSLSEVYYIEAVVYDINQGEDKKSETFTGYFVVRDPNAPEIDEPYTPVGARPLFEFIRGTAIDTWEFDIIGKASDNMTVASVSMVWINPASVNYAAMSQLAYFRDASYEGWALAPSNPNAPPNADTLFDDTAPNKVWTMNLAEPVTEISEDGKIRRVFEYSKTIKLKEHLNISPGEIGYDYLKSQVFVLKATDNSGQSTIITWSPQGDAKSPLIAITSATIQRWDNSLNSYVTEPADRLPTTGYHPPIAQLKTRDRIVIEGTWDEDSIASTITNFKDNFLDKNISIKINSIEIPKTTLRTGTTTTGTWSSTVEVGRELSEGNLKDTLVLSANITDLGGNPSEDGASWLVESDKLRFLRVSSTTTDGYYNAGKNIRIFLEFNKQVKLSGANPIMLLNTTGGTTGTAVFNNGENNALGGSTRQYFDYAVTAGQNANILTVVGTQGGSFTWQTPDGSESVTLITTGTPGIDQAKLPITTNPADRQEYPLTLMGGRTITIDTLAPTQVGAITSNPSSGYHREGTVLYFTMKLSETINITAPKLILNIRNGANTNVRTDDTVWVNDDTLTFSYTIKPGDYSGDSVNNLGVLKVTGIEGSINDQAGNVFSSAVNQVFNVYVDTLKPSAPALRIVTNTGSGYETVGTSLGSMTPWNPGTYNSSNAFNSSFPAGDIVRLETVYSENLHLEITAASQITGKSMRNIEYSINYGKDWEGRYAHTGGLSRTELDVLGQYDITARVVDTAGNYSDWTKPVTLNWDKGALLTRITTSASNGIKTNTTGLTSTPRTDTIPIILTFRNEVKINSVKFFFNIVDTGNLTVFKDIPAFTNSAAALSHTFVYHVDTTDFTVRPNGMSPNNTQTLQKDKLTLIAMTIDAQDEKGTNVSSMISLDDLVTDDTILHKHKEIYIQTGALQLAAGFPQITGSRNADDEYDATITLRFNSRISRGPSGKKITITQNSAGYRLPAVLTENQRSRYRNALGADFDKYYTRGTSGYINNPAGPDTTAKYILGFEYDTYNIEAEQSAAAGTIQRFAWDFLQSEKIELDIYSSLITLDNDTLTITLKDSNALKVLGAAYTIVFDGELVQDAEVGLPWAGLTHYYTVPNAAQPAIRIKKPQETLAAQAGSINTPALYISNMTTAMGMGTAQIRLDCRTPGSRVRYTTSANSLGSDTDNGSSKNIPWFDNYDNEPPVLNTAENPPGQPGDPTTSGSYFGSTTIASVDPITIGTAAESSGMYTGYRYRIRAAGVAGSTYSAPPYAEEIAYRSVIVFVGDSISTANGQNFLSGDQLWIRGGNTINSTTIPGFPLTLEDDWEALAANKERAGIRLMNKVGGASTNMNSSTWQWVTWDMTVPLYFDLYLGRGESDPVKAFQYGPVKYANHVGNWTPLRNYYLAFPGERRWLNSNRPNVTVGGYRQKPYAFSSTFNERPDDLAATIP